MMKTSMQATGSYAEAIKKALAGALEKTVPDFYASRFEWTLDVADIARGDYATSVAFVVARELKCAPLEVAQKIIGAIVLSDGIARVEAVAPGYINFWLSGDILHRELGDIHLRGDKYGGDSLAEKNQTWLIEHTSANPNKAMHLGHLRNNVLGMAISNIWEFSGVRVIRDYVSNNRGIAIARLMWGYLKFARINGQQKTDLVYWYQHQDEWQTPENAGKRSDIFVDELYVRASQDFQDDKNVETRVRHMVVDWEAGDAATRALWERVMHYSEDGQKMTLMRLGSKIDKTWYEHEHYQMGKDLIANGLEKGVFKKLDDGAILTDLAAYGIPDTIVQKADGTSLYITQDIALTKLKRDTFSPDKMFWVVGVEQSNALAQVFAICEQLGIGKRADYTHISYGWMSIKGAGSMSSRKGNVIYIDDLIDTAKERVVLKIDREKIGDATVNDVAEAVALGAIKYSILKVGRTTDMQFDIDASISFEGDSGPYLQYAYARTQAILRKAAESGVAANNSGTMPEDVIALIRRLARFPHVIADAGSQLSPHHICTYLNELAQEFSAYYARQVVVDSADASSSYRVAVVVAVGQVLKNGLRLLGIAPLDRM
ncbi:MAG: arginine--tRNA ligase [Candidatus Paceibacterota bacterium]|jgi:arginyl-tRNA synthetase